jgi:hypothetical protein
VRAFSVICPANALKNNNYQGINAETIVNFAAQIGPDCEEVEYYKLDLFATSIFTSYE